MKKKISILSVFVLILAMLFSFAGCSNEKVEESKAVIEKYYDGYDDNDTDDMTDVLHDDLIDRFESEETLAIALLSQAAFYGKIDEYKVVGTSYYKNNGEVSVSLELEVKYARTGETYIEKYEFKNDGEDMLISDIYHENEKPYNEVPEAFFESYANDDDEALVDLFSKSFFNYVPEEDLIAVLDELKAQLGSYKNYEQVEDWSYYSEDTADNLIVISEGSYNLNCENGTKLISIQLCLEDDEIKIYDIFWSGE